jgi:hypothetical protein
MSNQDDKKKVKITGAPQLTDMILGSLKPRVGKETTKWVAGLTEDAMEAAEQAARMQGVDMLTSSDQVPPKPATVTAVQFMDYLFDCFQQYEFEFNRSNPGPEMMVSIERPTMVVETLRSSLKSTETRQVFRGRLSTRFWTLLLRGHPEGIEGWILPIDKLISFASDPGHFTQFLQMTAQPNGDDFRFTIDSVEVTWDKIRSFGKQLFAALVHVAKTESAEGLTFTFQAKKTTGTASSAAEEQETTYDFNEHNPALDEIARATPSESTAVTQPRMAKPAQAAAPAAKPAPQPSTTAGGSLESAFEQLRSAFEAELEKLAKEGQDAFARQDMARVEKIFTRTNKLKQMREEASAQIDKWKAALKD